jgi:hypothetical protein
VGNVDLVTVWHNGRDAAVRFLTEFLPGFKIPDFVSLFKNPGIDLLRPTAAGYVGVGANCDDVDNRRSEDEGTDSNVIPQPTVPNNSSPTTLPALDSTTPYIFVEEQPEHYTSDDVDTDDSGSDGDSDTDYAEEQLDDETYGDDVALGVELEDFLSDDPTDHAHGDSGTDEPPPATYFVIDGYRVMKSSLVATLSSKWSKKVNLRTLRARGVAKEAILAGNRKIINDSNLEALGNLIKTGDLVAFLAKTSVALEGGGIANGIALVVMETTGFREGEKGAHMSVIEGEKLREKTTKVIGQVLQLQIVDASSSHWQWTHRYLRLDTASRDQVGS